MTFREQLPGESQPSQPESQRSAVPNADIPARIEAMKRAKLAYFVTNGRIDIPPRVVRKIDLD